MCKLLIIDFAHTDLYAYSCTLIIQLNFHNRIYQINDKFLLLL